MAIFTNRYSWGSVQVLVLPIPLHYEFAPLRVCRNQRIHIHKTFEGLATRGKCSMGWFFGFKLHLIINDKGEILNFMFTPGGVDDREPLKQETFFKKIKGKLYADKGYIGKMLFETLFVNGVQLLSLIHI